MKHAALGLGKLIKVTSEQSLKRFVTPIIGYLIERCYGLLCSYFSINICM